jgi:HAE1 family hydrophobic/amphiphilic exporter-1
MSKVSPNDLPIMSISATSDLAPTVFYQRMKDEFLPQIQQIRGVAELTIFRRRRARDSSQSRQRKAEIL